MAIDTAERVAAQEVDILAFGDSLMAGYGLPREEGFAPQLEKALRRAGVAASVINAGVSGNTAGNGRARIRWVLDALARAPDLAVVGLGANDMLRGVPASETKEDLDAILEEFARRGVACVLAGMLAPPFLGDRYVRAFNSIYPELARKHGALLYPFFLAGVAGQPAMNLADRMHPNGRGVAVMAGGIAPVVRRALERIGKAG